MSNPDKNPFAHTSDPDLETGLETSIETEPGDEETTSSQAKKGKGKSNKNLIIGAVILAFSAFAIYQVGMNFFGQPQKNTARSGLQSTEKPVLPKKSVVPDAVVVPGAATTPGVAANSSSLAVVIPDAPTSSTVQPSTSDGVSVSIGGGANSTSSTPTVNAASTVSPAVVDAIKKSVADAQDVKKQPTLTTDNNVMVKPAATPVQPSNDSKYAKAEDLEKLAGRVGSLETEMAGLKQLDGRMRKLEDRPASGVVIKKVYVPAKVSVPVSTPSAKAQTAEKQEAADVVKSETRPGFWVDEAKGTTVQGSDVMSRAKAHVNALFESGKTARAEVQKPSEPVVVQASSKAYQLVAIVQGRAWVKLSDGSMLTVQEGEALPNGVKIVKIDPRKDEVHTSAGVLK